MSRFPRLGLAPETRAALARLWPFVRPGWRRASGIGLFGLVAFPLALAGPLLLRHLFDQVVPRRALGEIAAVATALLLVVALSAFAAYHQRLAALRLRLELRQRIGRRLVRHVLRLPLAFFLRRERGELGSRLRDDVLALDGLFPDAWALAGTQLLRALGLLACLVFVDPAMALAGLLLVGTLVAFVGGLGPAMRRRALLSRERDAAVAGLLVELLAGMATIKANVAEAREGRGHGRLLARAMAAERAHQKLAAVAGGGVDLLAGAGLYGLALVGAWRIVVGASSIGDLLAFFALLEQLVGAAGELLRLLPRAQAGLASWQRLLELLDVAPERDTRGHGELPARARGQIELAGVRLVHEDGTVALDGVDLSIAPGEVVALVGRSGAGKSSLVGLLPRLLEPTAGEVRLDGRPLGQYPLAWLRRQVGVVPQQVFLFHRSVAENLRFGRPEAPSGELLAAASRAALSRVVIGLPAGFSTLVGDGGARLSGGERQRLAMARELLRDPPVLILDEATSSLDAENAALVQAALRRLVAGRTCLLIAHHFQALELATRIVVLEKGKIVEDGPREELLAAGGLYRMFADLQQAAPAATKARCA